MSRDYYGLTTKFPEQKLTSRDRAIFARAVWDEFKAKHVRWSTYRDFTSREAAQKWLDTNAPEFKDRLEVFEYCYI